MTYKEIAREILTAPRRGRMASVIFEVDPEEECLRDWLEMPRALFNEEDEMFTITMVNFEYGVKTVRIEVAGYWN